MKTLIGIILLGMLLILHGRTITDDGQVDDELETESLGDSFLTWLRTVMETDLFHPIDRLVQASFFNWSESDPTGFPK